MIRTEIVTLTVIPAIAYRRKLPSGGSGIVILKKGVSQPGIATISKTSGEPILAANTSSELYPKEAFLEAIALTSGLPYHKRGSVRLSGARFTEQKKAEPEPELWEEEKVAVSPAYEALVAVYTDKNGRLSYDLLNKDLIKFANSSKRVKTMREEGATPEEVRDYVVATRFRNVTGVKTLTDAEIRRMAELLDEVSPKGVFTELDAALRKKNAR